MWSSAPFMNLCKLYRSINVHDLSTLYLLLFSWGVSNVCLGLVQLSHSLVQDCGFLVSGCTVCLFLVIINLILFLGLDWKILFLWIVDTKLPLVWVLLDVYSVVIFFLSMVSCSSFNSATTILIKSFCCLYFFNKKIILEKTIETIFTLTLYIKIEF